VSVERPRAAVERDVIPGRNHHVRTSRNWALQQQQGGCCCLFEVLSVDFNPLLSQRGHQ
jgi:hypothetical protein